MRKKNRLASVAIVTALLVTGGTAFASSANATEAPDAGQETVALTFAGYDAERAAANGYDVRTDAQGWQYAVPTGTPDGSLVGATPKYNPATGQTKPANSSGMSPMNTVPGNCGTATLTLYSRTSGYTGYNMNGSFGPAVSHTWKINVSAATGTQVVDRSGLPPVPGVSLNWGTNFTYGVHATSSTLVNAVASGVVVTVLGDCKGLAPRDLWLG
jgi:hypothetical protein